MLRTRPPLEVQEEAALALGGSRMPAAIDLLLDALPRARDSHLRKILLRALSASRQPRAMEYLTALLKDGWSADAAAALEAKWLNVTLNGIAAGGLNH